MINADTLIGALQSAGKDDAAGSDEDSDVDDIEAAGQALVDKLGVPEEEQGAVLDALATLIEKIAKG